MGCRNVRLLETCPDTHETTGGRRSTHRRPPFPSVRTGASGSLLPLCPGNARALGEEVNAYSPLKPNSLATRTALSWALLSASSGDFPPSTSPNMSVQKFEDSSDAVQGVGGPGHAPPT